MRDSSRFVLIVPSAKLLWAYDNDSKLPFVNAFEQDDCIASHVVLVPNDFKPTTKSRSMNTFNSRQILLNRNFIQTGQGFKATFQSQIVAEYIIRPSASFLSDNAQFLCCEVSYPLTGTPVYHDLIERPGVEIRKPLFDGKILEVPEAIGLNLEKIKTDIYKLRDFKLLPVVYGQDLSQLDYEFTLLVNNFYCDHITTKDELIKLYNDTIDDAISKFQALGSTTINKIANETGLTGTDLAKMIGLHIENQLHQALWDKTMELCQEADTKTLDHCWKLKDISVEQVGIPLKNMTTLFDLDELVSEAVKLFGSIGNVRGVQSKTKALLMVMQILSGGTPVPDPLESEALQRVSKCSVHYNSELRHDSSYTTLQGSISADVLLSLMLLVVVRSNMLCINSILFYIQSFSFEDVNLGQLGYALSTLEAVLYHLDTPNSKIIALSNTNGHLWQSVKGEAHQTKSVIQDLKATNDDWISVVRSRNPTGLTLLMYYVQEKNAEMFKYLLDLDVFDTAFIIADRDSFGSSLFINALDSEQKDIIQILLEQIQSLDTDVQRKYYSRLNNWKRSVGHYIFHAHWLLGPIGQFIDWEQRDHSGQTPLFSVCRCYDHPNYTELLRDSFASWEESFKLRKGKENLSLAFHIDPKDNSLLHVLKDPNAIHQLLKYDLDVNWPNEHGYTPLMFYSKFSRVDSIKILLGDPRIDSHLQGENGVNAIEVARDLDTIIYLESEYILYSSIHN